MLPLTTIDPDSVTVSEHCPEYRMGNKPERDPVDTGCSPNYFPTPPNPEKL